MSSISINLPTTVLEAIDQVSAQMRLSSEEFVQLALSFFMQQNVAELAIIALERMEDGAKTFDYADRQETFELSFSIHPDAKEELEMLDTEQQASLLESLFIKVTQPDNEEGTDLVLQDFEDAQLVYSRLSEIDIIYKLSEQGLSVYLIHPFIELEPSDDSFFAGDDEDEEYLADSEGKNEPYKNH